MTVSCMARMKLGDAACWRLSSRQVSQLEE